MPITIKKGRAKDTPRPAPVLEGAPAAKVVTKKKLTANEKMAAALNEYRDTDPRYIAAQARPRGEQATTCEFCGAVYLLCCDAEEKDFCLNFLSKTGVIKTIAEWSPYADKGNQQKLDRLAERKKGVP